MTASSTVSPLLAGRELDGALQHAAAACDWRSLGQLLLELIPAASWDRRAAQIDQWLAVVPAPFIQYTEDLATVAASNDLARGQGRRAAQIAANAGASPGAAIVEALGGTCGGTAMRTAARDAAQRLPVGNAWLPLASFAEGAGAFVAGAPLAVVQIALDRGAREGLAAAPAVAALCEAQLGLALMLDGQWDPGVAHANRARHRIAAGRVDDTGGLVLVHATAALARAHTGRFDEAHVDLAQARMLAARRTEFPAWWDATIRLAVTRTKLRLGDLGAARAELAVVDRLVAPLTDAGGLRRAADLARADAARLADAALPEPLTTAELRVLRLLPSHLSFREIGGRLNVSANTIKSQAHAVYRKLGATSRTAAVDRALHLGLIDRPAWERDD